jgi:two-component system chemotaxis sensor kinase CheA
LDEMEAIKVTFFLECEELLADLENGLLTMRAGDADNETVNAVFRAVHSIKGGAGAFGFESLVRFSHVFETLMDKVRSGHMPQSTDLAEALLRAADVLADLVSAARNGVSGEDERSVAIAAELEEITRTGVTVAAGAFEAPRVEVAVTELSPAAEPTSDLDDPDFSFTPMTITLDDPAPQAPDWTVEFSPLKSLYASANEPAVLLRELERLGEAVISLDSSRLPDLADLDPDGAYLDWKITLKGDVDQQAVRDVFDFVEGDCILKVESAEEPASPMVDISALIEGALSHNDSLPAEVVAAAPPLPPVQEIPVSVIPPIAPKPAPAVAADPQAFAPQATIRVDPERIDKLIDLVGELVINQAMLAQRVAESGLAGSSSLAMGLDDLEQLTREIQESVMAIRAQPVKSVFQRMPRLVRETAAMTGKQVRLVTDGEATEVDKTVIERIADPITHMIRNAIDHGLESAEDRVAAGKPPEGTVRLAALHRGGRIVIEVSDDGRGINRKRVQAIAIEKELIAPDATLSDEEIDNLIFLPGFSTAAVVSDVSGRGVGMDVVRRSIQALGGRITIASRPSQGSTFTLSLPLTLAVLDGMVVDVEGQTLIVPLNHIVESLRPKAGEIHRLGPTGMVLAVRGDQVPLVDIGQILGFRSHAPSPVDRVVLLIENEDGGRAALVADAIQGQRQVVIKSLEANYRQVDGIAAATILGDGRVALILDVDALVAMRRREPPTRPSFDPLQIAAE